MTSIPGQKQFFVGYETLEALLSTHEHGVALYLTVMLERRPTRDPQVVARNTYVMATDVQDGVCRYWRCRLGCTGERDGIPLQPEEDERLRQHGEQVKCVLRRAIRRDFDVLVQAAVVSFPVELALLEGSTGLLHEAAAPGADVN
jgi:hypothetical protein